ncbi:Heavy metal-associated isoprenylated plant protein [Actinidia chinensis var. chinensis]|uniref:Heavy metal-associated isoprenylated plant protein n=1 Tax=Actinidia chinensis var. chinensis TaxID=1590841 RepID=A0A2R6PJM0_ACTCC|nr:Heavy metal-associated isoprenylated plant protein [Actinidia chinensis var. chinensis]
MPHNLCLLNIPSPCTNECNVLILHSLSLSILPPQIQNNPSFSIPPPFLSPMVPELEKPRVTEIQVRIDCNGCVQKIKKALHGINGIYDLYIDFPQQKLTIIGWADPEKIIKAIKKTRKTATICFHSETSDPQAQPTEAAPGQPAEQAPPPDAVNPPATEAPPAEASPPAEPLKAPPPPEKLPLDTTPSTESHPAQPARPKDVEEVHVIYHHPPDYGYRYGGYSPSYGHSYGGQWNNYPNGPVFRQEPPTPAPAPTPTPNPAPAPAPAPPVYVTHSYNTYKPSPYVTHSYNAYKPSPYVTHSYNAYKPSPYATEYEYIRSPPDDTHYSRSERYSEDYSNGNSANGNISSMFSDENPNACRIV